jgi:hypothetical protein
MKKILPFLLLFLSSTFLGICQENAAQASISDFSSPEKNSYSLFLEESERRATPTAWEALQLELDLKASKKSDSLALLRVIFQKTHQRLFKNYRQHSTFSNMLDQGDYDCVSGSAALGLLLDRYGYSFDVIETDYHVFIQVYLGGKTLVLESTLPGGGLITSPSAVSNYLAAYLSEGAPIARNISEGLAGTKVITEDNTIFRKVNLTQLSGLQHYNEAIVHFNKQNYKQAIDLLTKAYAQYPSERIEGLKALSIDLAYHSYGIDIRK